MLVCNWLGLAFLVNLLEYLHLFTILHKKKKKKQKTKNKKQKNKKNKKNKNKNKKQKNKNKLSREKGLPPLIHTS